MASEVLFFAQRLIYLDIEYDNVFYTPTNAPGGCCGGLSTLRGTPPPHLFDVDPFWNDPRDPNYSFRHRSILKICLEPLWVAMGGSWAPFWGPWGFAWASFWWPGRCLGLHFKGSGVPVGAFGGPWARPWPPKSP